MAKRPKEKPVPEEEPPLERAARIRAERMAARVAEANRLAREYEMTLDERQR